MNSIDLKIHGILDYVMVVIFALFPLILGLSGFAAFLGYTLAVVHLAMTLLTDFELGYMDIIKVQIHKLIEFAVGPILIIIAFFFAADNSSSPAIFFVIMGAIIILVGNFTDYNTMKSVEEEESTETRQEEMAEEEMMETAS